MCCCLLRSVCCLKIHLQDEVQSALWQRLVVLSSSFGQQKNKQETSLAHCTRKKKHHDNTCFLVHLSRRKDYAWWHCIYQGAPHFVHELRICDLLHVLLPDVSPEVVAGYDWALRWWTRWYHQAGMGQGKVLHNHGCGCVTTCSDIHGHGGMVIFCIFSDNYWIVYYNSIIEVILCTYTL